MLERRKAGTSYSGVGAVSSPQPFRGKKYHLERASMYFLSGPRQRLRVLTYVCLCGGVVGSPLPMKTVGLLREYLSGKQCFLSNIPCRARGRFGWVLHACSSIYHVFASGGEEFRRETVIDRGAVVPSVRGGGDARDEEEAGSKVAVQKSFSAA